MYRKLLFLVALAALTVAEDLSNGNPGTNMELATGYKLQGTTDHSLQGNGLGYGYLGTKFSTLNSENYPPETTTATALSYVLRQMAPVGYFAAGAAGAMSLWYLMSTFGLPASKKFIKRMQTRNEVNEFEEAAVEDAAEEVKAEDASKTKTVSKKDRRRRRRRSVAEATAGQNPADFTTLSTVVLNSIQNFQCLQKTICQAGKQMALSAERAKSTDSLLSKVLPGFIHQSDYYQNLMNSMRGDLECEKFECDLYS